MRKFLERSLKKLQQDQQEKKSKQQFEELVQQKKEKVRIEFFAATEATGRDLTLDNTYKDDGLKFATLFNTLKDENVTKEKRKRELDEQIEELEKHEPADQLTQSTMSQVKKKDIANWSVNLSPGLYSKLTMEMASQYHDHVEIKDLDFLKEKLDFLTDTYGGLQTQQIKEDEITEALDLKVLELQEEYDNLTKQYNQARYVMNLMQQSLTDTQKLQHVAKNKLLRTMNNLNSEKTNLNEANIEGKDFLQRLRDEQENGHAVAQAVEEKYAELLAKLDLAKKSKEEFERKYQSLVEREKSMVNKILDADTTIKYVDILSYLEKRYIQKQLVQIPLFGAEGGSSNPHSSRSTPRNQQSSDPRSILFKRSPTSRKSQEGNVSSRNMQQGQQISSFTEFTLEQRIVSANRSRAGSASPARRVSQMSSRRREFVIHKISSFCESHDLEALIDELLSIHGAMALQEQSLRNAYEKASLEKRKKEEQLHVLKIELSALFKSSTLNDEYNKLVNTTHEDVEIDGKALPSMNQMNFTFKEIIPVLDEPPLHKKLDNFLLVCYLYLIGTLNRISKFVHGMSRRSQVVSTEVIEAHDEITKYLSDTLSVPLDHLKDVEAPLKSAKKELPTSGVYDFISKENLTINSELNGRSSNGSKQTRSQIFWESTHELDPKQFEEIIEQQKHLPLTKAQIIQNFIQLFPNAVSYAEKWAELIRSDPVMLLIATSDILRNFLLKKQAQYGPNEAPQKTIEDIQDFSNEVRNLLKERFICMLERLHKLFKAILQEKSSKIYFLFLENNQLFNESIAFEMKPKYLLRSSKVELLLGNSKTGDEKLQEAMRKRATVLLRNDELEKIEHKGQQKARMKSEEQKRNEKERESKSLDEIRQLITELAKDEKVRVRHYFSQVSKENGKNKTALELSDETKATLLKRKNDSLPPLKLERGLSPSNSHLNLRRAGVGGKNAVVNFTDVLVSPPTDQGSSTRNLYKRAAVLARQPTIIPMKMHSNSFELEQEHMNNERNAVLAEQERKKLILEGVLDPEEAPVTEEENNKRDKVKKTSYQEIMENSVKKIYEEAKILKRLAKLEKADTKYENTPIEPRKKKTSFVPSDITKFTMSYIDMNALRKKLHTSSSQCQLSDNEGSKSFSKLPISQQKTSHQTAITFFKPDSQGTQETAVSNRPSTFSKRVRTESSERNQQIETSNTTKATNTKRSEESPFRANIRKEKNKMTINIEGQSPKISKITSIRNIYSTTSRLKGRTLTNLEPQVPSTLSKSVRESSTGGSKTLLATPTILLDRRERSPGHNILINNDY